MKSMATILKISAPAAFAEALRTYCKAHDIPISTLVRHAVREYWEKRAVVLPHDTSREHVKNYGLGWTEGAVGTGGE